VVGQRQINIRLADEDVAILEASAFLKGQPLSDLARAVLLSQVEALRDQPRIRNVLRSRAEEQAEERGVLTSLDARRGGADAS
jgi:hypothetical protein